MTEIREDVKRFLRKKDLTLKDMSISIGMQYDRLSHIVNGIRAARPEEDEKIQSFMNG